MRIERVTKKGVVTAIYRQAKEIQTEGEKTFADLGLSVYKFKKRYKSNGQGAKGSLYVVHVDAYDDMCVSVDTLDYIYGKGYWVEDFNHVKYKNAQSVVMRLKRFGGLQSHI